MIKGLLQQTDENGAVLQNGISKEDAVFSLDKVDESVKSLFEGSAINQTIRMDVKKAFTNDADLASFLGIDKEFLDTMNPNFQVTITDISNFRKSEVNQDLFDKVFGADKVKSVDEFRDKIKEDLRGMLTHESDFKFMLDSKDKIITKLNIDLPEEFLKRWLKATSQDKDLDDETIDKEFAPFTDGLRWQMIKSKIIRDNELKVTEEEVLDFAKEIAARQFKQYGITELPDEQLENYAKEMLKKDEEKKKIFEKKFEDQVVEYIKECVNVEKNSISAEDFNKLFTDAN